MKEKPKGVNRKITNDGEEKIREDEKKLILIRGDKRFLYSTIHLARFDSYSDNTATHWANSKNNVLPPDGDAKASDSACALA
ncbi:hypothetical protein HTS61_00160 [Escherichia coli]|nr:hypothetical protein [Escherichia coli]